MAIWLNHKPHEGDESTWAEWPPHPREVEADEDGVRITFFMDYGRGSRDVEFSIEPEDFVQIAGMMMASDAAMATAAFAAVLAKKYPLPEVEEDEDERG